MNACYFLEPTGIKTRWQVLWRTNAQSDWVQGQIGKFFVTLAAVVCQQKNRYALRRCE